MSGRKLKPCGTPAAAERHRRRGEEICPACRTARNAKFVQYHRARKRGPERITQEAEEIALRQLRINHEAEFRRLRLEALKRLTKR